MKLHTLMRKYATESAARRWPRGGALARGAGLPSMRRRAPQFAAAYQAGPVHLPRLPASLLRDLGHGAPQHETPSPDLAHRDVPDHNELDETYVGGRPRKVPREKLLPKDQRPKRKQGRATDRACVFVAVERGGRVVPRLVPSHTKGALGGSVRESMHNDAILVTDELPAETAFRWNERAGAVLENLALMVRFSRAPLAYGTLVA